MHILTFDIEDWFHTHQNRKHHSGHIWANLPSRVIDNSNRILQMLDELELKASFFILGWVAEKHPQLVKDIHKQGHEIGSHSYWHHNANLLRPEDFERDLKRSIDVVSNIIGEAVRAFRAPGFSLKSKDIWAFDILESYGIQWDSSVQMNPSHQSNPFQITFDNKKILEFPLLNSPFYIPYTGGGYFRAFPDSLLSRLFRKEKYRLLYFHPRDFDAENPYTNLFTVSRNWLNGYQTGNTMDRLKRVLSQHQVHTIGEAANIYFKTSSVS